MPLKYWINNYPSGQKKQQYGIIALASATDPYIPAEEHYQLTRQFLEVILRHRFPVYVMTRSPLVFRDLDLLHRIEENAVLPVDLKSKNIRRVIIASSFCTLDKEISRRFEPNADPPMKRMEMLARIKKEGFFTGAHYLPLFPRLTDTEESLRSYVQATKEFGLDYLLAGSLTLFGDQEADSKTLVLKIMERYYPDLSPDYHLQFSRRNGVTVRYQKKLDTSIKQLCSTAGLKYGIM
jgi:DNA repair photolyase